MNFKNNTYKDIKKRSQFK